MKAWRVTTGAKRELLDVPVVDPAAGGVVVRLQAAPILSYQRDVLDGKVPYAVPESPYTPGANGVGVIERVGPGVYHLAPGERVFVEPHLVANERVREPAQILIGLTAMGASRFAGVPEAARSLQRDYRDGTFAEMAHLPASVVTRLPDSLRDVPAETLAALAKFVVPYGGFLRGRLMAGERVIVNGATGYFGSAGVVLAVALGASRVVAAGRDRTELQALGEADKRVAPVVLTGDIDADARQLVDAAGGSADLALDMVGGAKDTRATSAALRALRRRGRLVLMGSATAPLELNVGDMLSNEWQVLGNFMYPPNAPLQLAELVASGQLDLSCVRTRSFALEALEEALEAAAAMRGLTSTVLKILGPAPSARRADRPVR